MTNRVAAWRGSGDCTKCSHIDRCKRECRAHESRVAALVRKALLLDALKKGGGA